MIGVLGLGNFATQYYVHLLNLLYNKNKGGYATAPFILKNIDFHPINANLPDNTKNIASYLKNELRELTKLGVQKIIIPNITLHETIDKYLSNEDFYSKIIHPFKILKLPPQSIYLLGSYYSMQSHYIRNHLSSKDISIVNLTDKLRVQIDTWRKEIYQSGKAKKIQSEWDEIIKDYNDKRIIVACTELSILCEPYINDNRIIDLAHQQVKFALGLEA